MWYQNQNKVLFWLLKPLTYLYQAAIQLRINAYQRGWWQRTHIEVPTVVIGNLTVGGTGKTPFVIALSRWLKARGFRPGVISRGYGGDADEFPQEVTLQSKIREVGDEAWLLAKHSDCPVFIDPVRVRGAQALLSAYRCDVMLFDDGLQHMALQGDIEIALLDAQRGLGNQYCLPAGPLREPENKLKQVDFVIINGEGDFNYKHPHAFRCHYLFHTIRSVLNPDQEFLVDDLKGESIQAVTAIGHPERFFNDLKKLGLNFQEHVFADHHLFQVEDFNFIHKGEVVIMTEKDAVKCQKFANSNFYFVPIEIDLDPEFKQLFLQKLSQVLNKRMLA